MLSGEDLQARRRSGGLPVLLQVGTGCRIQHVLEKCLSEMSVRPGAGAVVPGGAALPHEAGSQQPGRDGCPCVTAWCQELIWSSNPVV